PSGRVVLRRALGDGDRRGREGPSWKHALRTQEGEHQRVHSARGKAPCGGRARRREERRLCARRHPAPRSQDDAAPFVAPRGQEPGSRERPGAVRWNVDRLVPLARSSATNFVAASMRGACAGGDEILLRGPYLARVMTFSFPVPSPEETS